MADFTHIWYWRQLFRPPIKGPERRGQLCRPLRYGGMNSVLVEMESGERVVTLRHAIMSLTAKYTQRLLKAVRHGQIELFKG